LAKNQDFSYPLTFDAPLEGPSW